MKMMSMVVVALLAGPAAAFAQEEGVRGTWSATFSGGASLPAGGEFHEGGSGTVLGLATSVDAKTNADVFDPGLGWRAGLGYGVSRRVELFADFSWSRSTASELSVGNVASLDLRAAFGDYTSYGVDGGMRYHFAPGANVNPYVTALAAVWAFSSRCHRGSASAWRVGCGITPTCRRAKGWRARGSRI